MRSPADALDVFLAHESGRESAPVGLAFVRGQRKTSDEKD